MDVEDCVFCDILAGRRAGSFVYRDKIVSAFLTKGPVNPGHILVVPLRHAPGIADLTPAETEAMFALAGRLAAAIRQSPLRCNGINYWLADGEAAFQDVFHAHLHIIPRFRGDSFKVAFDRQSPQRDELDEIAQSVRLHIV
jgi:diadenosine tetraphosphate (Ap4A) HIT family hydrolase